MKIDNKPWSPIYWHSGDWLARDIAAHSAYLQALVNKTSVLKVMPTCRCYSCRFPIVLIFLKTIIYNKNLHKKFWHYWWKICKIRVPRIYKIIKLMYYCALSLYTKHTKYNLLCFFAINLVLKIKERNKNKYNLWLIYFQNKFVCNILVKLLK